MTLLRLRPLPRRRRTLSCVTIALALATTAAPPAGAAPARRPALDVYFLVDATGSMMASADGVAAALDAVTGRLAKRATLRHGYGVFRDFAPLAPLGTYQRLSPVRANGGRTPLIDYSGGGSDLGEAHTLGLDGALGVAHEPFTIMPEPAEFAPGARKLVVLVTDAAMKQGWGYPTIDEVAERLRAAGVAVVALQVLGNLEVGHEETRADLREVAVKTRAHARRSIDCQGDGRVDIRRGGPLVCEFDPRRRVDLTAFADALV